MPLSYIVGSVTQGGADAFAQAEVATGLSGQTQLSYLVREIVFEIPRISLAAAVNLELALARRSKAAMPNITDRDVLAKWKVGQELVTSGGISNLLVARFTFAEDDELLVVEDPIYFCIDSNATTLTQTAYFRLGYTIERISAVDRLTLLTQSLET